jgi:DNA mismatch repair ATPase MutS
MLFHSILFTKKTSDKTAQTAVPPEYFTDLNLNQIIDTITQGKEKYNLKPFFYTPLHDYEEISYRFAIMQDMENENLLKKVISFEEKMQTVYNQLNQSQKLFYKYQKESYFIDTVIIYCEAVINLSNDLTITAPRSTGFLALHSYLKNYIASAKFTILRTTAKQIKQQLSAIQYILHIKGNSVTVHAYKAETDYNILVKNTFAKFSQEASQDYKVKFYIPLDMNHIEAQILNVIANLNPEIFSALADFCQSNGNFLDETVGIFDRQIQFYIAYLQYINKLKQTGLNFCYPQMADNCKSIYAYESFDLALAIKCTSKNQPIICNDFYLKNNERIFVVSGPNQGGKTTFARTFGQLHYLAGIGCPVPGKKARLFLFDNLFTHFERAENSKTLSGKLQDDLLRIHDIFEQSTENSIIIMNEIFTSTTLNDAVFLSTRVMDKIIKLDSLCVWVTFIDELADMGEKVVSMVSMTDPENPAKRTFKIVRQAPDGCSYAISIAKKYCLTYNCLKERIKS